MSGQFAVIFVYSLIKVMQMINSLCEQVMLYVAPSGRGLVLLILYAFVFDDSKDCRESNLKYLGLHLIFIFANSFAVTLFSFTILLIIIK